MRPCLVVLVWVVMLFGTDAESHQPHLEHESNSKQGPFYTLCYGHFAEGYGPFDSYQEAEKEFTRCRQIKYPTMITPVAEFCAEYHSDCKELKWQGPNEVAFKHSIQGKMKVWWEVATGRRTTTTS